jgi:hypothetical protein
MRNSPSTLLALVLATTVIGSGAAFAQGSAEKEKTDPYGDSGAPPPPAAPEDKTGDKTDPSKAGKEPGAAGSGSAVPSGIGPGAAPGAGSQSPGSMPKGGGSGQM